MSRGALLAGIVAALAAASACDDALAVDPECRDVPDGGCPMGRGDPCADPTCAAAYECTESSLWRFDHACSARDAAAGAWTDPGATDAGASPGAAPDVTGDATVGDVAVGIPGANGGPGCAALEGPDCPLGVALACGAGCCDCEDLFVCKSGSWEPWGMCGAGVISPL
jgi:hypothetical protein